MMRPANELPEVYVCLDPIDFRKQIDGLAAVVQEVLALDPFSEKLFCFTNRRRDRCKILYFERSGFVLWQKRLERERFCWRFPEDRCAGNVVTLTGQELNYLLDGFDLRMWRAHAPLRFSAIA